MPHLFCFGLGYSAGALAARLAAQGWQITGTSTQASGADGVDGGAARAVAPSRPSSAPHAATQATTNSRVR